MNCWLCENQGLCEVHDKEEWEERMSSVAHLFDVTPDNVHMVNVDEFEAAETPKTQVAPIAYATKAQLGYLKTLFEQRKDNEEARILRAHLLSEYKAGRLSKLIASQAIEDVKRIEKDKEPNLIVHNPQHGEVWVTTDGLFVRIKENQSGTSLYGMKWSWTVEKWEYTPGILNTLDHKITAEEAAAWGHEHQWCVFCSRPLSDPRSEFAGYGEKCAENNHLPWGETE